jgi:acyl carrier protein
MTAPSKPRLTREQVHEVLWKLTAQRVDREPTALSPKHRLIQDLGMDSLDFVELTMELEEQLGMLLPAEFQEKSDTTLEEIEEAVCKDYAGP